VGACGVGSAAETAYFVEYSLLLRILRLRFYFERETGFEPATFSLEG
jgi:hypothetical protein